MSSDDALNQNGDSYDRKELHYTRELRYKVKMIVGIQKKEMINVKMQSTKNVCRRTE
jgi:hypothetical protein